LPIDCTQCLTNLVENALEVRPIRQSDELFCPLQCTQDPPQAFRGRGLAACGGWWCAMCVTAGLGGGCRKKTDLRAVCSGSASSRRRQRHLGSVVLKLLMEADGQGSRGWWDGPRPRGRFPIFSWLLRGSVSRSPSWSMKPTPRDGLNPGLGQPEMLDLLAPGKRMLTSKQCLSSPNGWAPQTLAKI